MIQRTYFCVIALCNAGSYSDGESCIACSVGQYQPYHSQTFCFECESGYSTEMEGSTDVAECIEGKNCHFILNIAIIFFLYFPVVADFN